MRRRVNETVSFKSGQVLQRQETTYLAGIRRGFIRVKQTLLYNNRLSNV